jgi:hypothetical protein
MARVEHLLPEQDVMVRTVVDFSVFEVLGVVAVAAKETKEDGTSTISVTEESVPVVK